LGAREAVAATGKGGIDARAKPKLDKSFYGFLFVITLFTLGNSSDAFIILRGQERGLNVAQVMGMLLSFNAVYALLSGPAGYLSDRIGRRRLLVAGWLIYSAIYLGFALAQNGLEIWTLFGFYGLYYAMVEGVSRAFVADLVPAAQRGTAYGFYHAAVGLATLPASLVAGILWQGLLGWTGFGPSAPFYFGAILALLSSILLVTYVKKPAI
jgi:MFS family permease